MKATDSMTASVTVELFGHARLVCGVKQIEIELPTESDASDLATALHHAVPSLRGVVVDEVGHGLMASHTANLNGLSFLESSVVPIADGDQIYVFSSQAGG
jgi:molybdopterin converting factor small subunit